MSTADLLAGVDPNPKPTSQNRPIEPQRQYQNNSAYRSGGYGFSDATLEDNPWEEENLRPEYWGTLSQRIHGSKEDLKISALAGGSGNLKHDEEWGDFETFRVTESYTTQPPNVTVGATQTEFQVTSRSDSPNNPLSEDAWMEEWESKLQEPSTSAWSQQQEQKFPKTPVTEKPWISDWDPKPHISIQISSSHPERNKDTPTEESKPPRDENVLFDADEDYDIDEDVEFGDFEGLSAPKREEYVVKVLPIKTGSNSIKSQPPLLDLDIDSSIQTWMPITNHNSKSSQHRDLMDDYTEWEPSGSVLRTPTLSPEASKGGSIDIETRPVASVDNSEAWDDFQEIPSMTNATAGNNASSFIMPKLADPLPIEIKPILPVTATVSRSSAPPPTNIPPPSLIISLFNPLITKSQFQFFHPVSTLPANLRTHPAVLIALKSLLILARILAHILAGRKLRWKRDTILQQATRIGPAGRGGGMKLSSVDKAEAAREDREAIDAVHTWREKMAVRLRAAAISAGLGAAVVPELSETMPVRTAVAKEGAIASAKACALCGLKRDERVGKVDGEVLDSFGEWWVDHWGHRECWGFWETQNGALVQR